MRSLGDDIILGFIGLCFIPIMLLGYVPHYCLSYIGYKFFKYPKPEWIFK